MVFPTVTGFDLLRRKRTLPRDFRGTLNLVFVAFQRWQQAEIDSWMPLARELKQQIPGLASYELPTIQSRNVVSRMLINEGMRAGIPDPGSREGTITLYLDKDQFRSALHMPDEDHIYVFVVDRTGDVVFRARGPRGADAEIPLRQSLHDLFQAR